ncbi:Cold sensitive U2 snRNA suppressor 2 [Spathaspora sp. JA1]|nr:Cold sensitive U2 snRNA suppressor 2 [Spathaspora sp. JA1]
MTTFPDRPPSPERLGSIDTSTIDDRIHLEQNNWIYEHESTEYIYNYNQDKWIRKRPREEESEEVNKTHIKQARTEQMSKLKQKLSELKQGRTTSALFISNLPLTITQLEIVELFNKYGNIAMDKQGQPRVKLYTSEDKFNGQALVIYEKSTSVTMAIDMMDGVEVQNKQIKVEPATFKEKEEKEDKQKEDYKNTLNSIKQKILYKNVVILQGMFRKQEYNQQLKQDITEDIKDELEQGTIQSIQFMVEQQEIHIKFTQPKYATLCIEKFNNRWYDGLKVVATN